MMQIPDPVHGYIELDGMFAHIVNTPEFQRLRSVEQGSFRPVYPGARHDRFAHSLGTYHLAKKFAAPFFRNLANDLGIVLPAEEQELLTRTFLYAALLHDIGHAPFSHTTEGFFEEKLANNGLPVIWDDLCKAVKKVNSVEGDLFSARKKKCGAAHEIMSATVMVEQWRHFHMEKPFVTPEVDLALAARMVIGFTYSPGDLVGLKDEDVVSLGVRNCLIQMINYSLLDVDRLDYMGRDKLMSGFVNATLDLDCLAQSVTATGMPDAWVLWKDENPPRQKSQFVRRVREEMGATLLKDQEIELPAGTLLEEADAELAKAGAYFIRNDVSGVKLGEGTFVILTETGSVALCKKNKHELRLPAGTQVESAAQPGSIRKLAKDVDVYLKAGTHVLPDLWLLWKYEARPRLKDEPTLIIQKKTGAALAKDQVLQLPVGTRLETKDGRMAHVNQNEIYLLRQDVSGLVLEKDSRVVLKKTGSVGLCKERDFKLPKGTEVGQKDQETVLTLAADLVVHLPVDTYVRPDDVVDVKLAKDEVELMPDGTEKVFGVRNRLKLRPTWLAPGYRDAALRVFDLMFQAKLSHDAWVLAAPAGAYDAALLAHCIRQLDDKIKDQDPKRKYMGTVFTAKALSRDGLDFAGKRYRLLSDVDVAADLKAQSGGPFDELYTRELGKRRIAAWRSYYEYHHIFNCPEMGLTPEKVYEFFRPLMKYLDEKHVLVFDKDAYELILGMKTDADGKRIPKATDNVVRAAELLREFLMDAHTKRKPDEQYNVVLLDRTSNFTMKLDPAEIRIVFSDHTRESKPLPLRSGRYNYSTYGDMTGITNDDKRSKPYFYIMRHGGLGHEQLEKLRKKLAPVV